MLKPRETAPEMSFATVDAGTWTLSQRSPKNLSMVVAYRGLHCPVCRGYLKELNDRVGEFAERGVEVVAVSTDGEERARAAKTDWELPDLTIGYGLSIEEARKMGLFISTSRGKTSIGIEEPAMFNEPGLYLVKPDGTLYSAFIQTTPFARPKFDDILKAVDFINANDYPARGEA